MESTPEEDLNRPIYDQEVEEEEEDEDNLIRLEDLLAKKAAREASAPRWTLRDLMQQEDSCRESNPFDLPHDVRQSEPDNLWFRLTDHIGTASHGTINVYKALRVYQDFKVLDTMPLQRLFYAVKYVPRGDQESEAYWDLQRRIERSNRIPPNPNIIGFDHSFTCDEGNFCVTLPLMEFRSIRDIMLSKFPDGIPEDYIVVVMKKALEGLSVIHQNGQVHGEVSLGHIFLTQAPEIKLAFGASVFDHDRGQNQAPSSSSSRPTDSISDWAAAPEIHFVNNVIYTTQADIWMIGVTALEMAYGCFRVPGREILETFLEHIRRGKKLPMKETVLQGEGRSRRNTGCFSVALEFKKSRAFSKGFEKMVMKCLAKSPNQRPRSAEELLKMEVFKNSSKDVKDFPSLVMDMKPAAAARGVEDST